MGFMFRVIVVIVVLVAMYFVAYWGSVLLIPSSASDWIRTIFAGLVSVSAGWFVWRSVASDNVLSNVVIGAVVVGSIGFVAGFFGPILLTPQANQGPLLGIFITGPLGFFLGAIGGLVFSWVRAKNKPKPGLCSACNYDLTGNTSGRCPECGAHVSSPARQT